MCRLCTAYWKTDGKHTPYTFHIITEIKPIKLMPETIKVQCNSWRSIAALEFSKFVPGTRYCDWKRTVVDRSTWRSGTYSFSLVRTFMFRLHVVYVWHAVECGSERIFKMENNTTMSICCCCRPPGVSLTVPEGAVAKGCTEVVFVVVLRENKDRPKLSGQFSDLQYTDNLILISLATSYVVHVIPSSDACSKF